MIAKTKREKKTRECVLFQVTLLWSRKRKKCVIFRVIQIIGLLKVLLFKQTRKKITMVGGNSLHERIESEYIGSFFFIS